MMERVFFEKKEEVKVLKATRLSAMEASMPSLDSGILNTVIGRGNGYEYDYDYDYDYSYDYVYFGGTLPEVVITPNRFFNTDDTITHLNDNANAKSQGKCGRYIREALEAGGFDTTGHPSSACGYSDFLSSRGLPTVDFSNNYLPRTGDIAVFGAIPDHQDGHIQMWNGSQWVSDFYQNGFWPGSDYSNAHNSGSGSVDIFRPYD